MGGNPVAQLVFGLEGQVRPSCAPRRCRALSRSRQEIIDLGVGKNSFKLVCHRNPKLLFQNVCLEFSANIFNVRHHGLGASQALDDDPGRTEVD